ncbi:hypothetical protein Hanom_Chr17g01538881 [Helianthus anomalus]
MIQSAWAYIRYKRKLTINIETQPKNRLTCYPLRINSSTIKYGVKTLMGLCGLYINFLPVS